MDRGEHAEALALALAGWRVHRSTVLAQLIDALAARVPAPAISGRDKAAFQRGYLVLAASRELAAATTLASGLAHKVPIVETRYLVPERDRKRHARFLDRVAALLERDPDPRLARAAIEVIASAPFSVEDGAAVYQPVLALALHGGDERTLAGLEAVLAKPVAKSKTLREYFAKALPPCVVKLQRALAKCPPADPSLAEVLARLCGPAPIVRRAGDLDALLAECLANPDDDAPRLVYADALLEQGDPRGEFLQLQLRAEHAVLSEAERKRVAAIQRKHEKAWLGDLARVTKLRVFRRGFLDEAELLQGAAAEPAVWQAVAADPRMATVRTLHKGSASTQLYRSFVTSPALLSLRSFEVPTDQMLGELDRLGRPVDELALSALTPRTMGLLDRVGPVLGLSRLTFETTLTPSALVERVAAWPGRRHYQQLVAVRSHKVADAWNTDDLRWLWAFDTLGVPRLGLEIGPYANRLVLTRTAAGIEADFEANQEHLIVRLLARALPQPLTRLVVRGNPQVWFEPGPAFTTALAKLPAATVVELRDRWRSVERGGRRE